MVVDNYATAQLYCIIRYLCDVSLLVYELIHVKLSIIAASTLYLAFIAYNVPPPSDAFLSTTLLVDASHVNVVARAMVNPGFGYNYLQINGILYLIINISKVDSLNF